MTTLVRESAFGQGYEPGLLDRFGVWLSAVQLRRWVKSFRGLRVGDFGCGYHAAFARTILPEVASLTLADIAVTGELRLEKRVRVIEGPLPDTLAEVESASLDVVLCVSVLEHLAEPQRALAEFFRVLAPGGVCLLNVPSWRGKRFLEFSAFRLGTSPREEMDDHKMYYDVRDLWPRLVQAGFPPSGIHCFSHKFGLNTFAACTKRKG